jgi:hypothetical protein
VDNPVSDQVSKPLAEYFEIFSRKNDFEEVRMENKENHRQSTDDSFEFQTNELISPQLTD